MNRRFLVRNGSLLATLPLWLREGFAAALADGERVYDEAWARAKSAGKPLLVIVIPKEHGWTGSVMGEVLNYGPDELFEELALCELVCAPASVVEKRVTGFKGEPLLVLVETDGSGGSKIIDPALGSLADWYGNHEGTAGKTDWRAREHAPPREPVDERIRVVADGIHRALVPNARTLERRAMAVREIIPKREVDRLRKGAEEETLRIAAVLLLESRVSPEGQQIRERLRDATRKRYVTGRVPGSKWARSGGCGGPYVERLPEDPKDPPGSAIMTVACGMGHVPVKSARFLLFYTQSTTK